MLEIENHLTPSIKVFFHSRGHDVASQTHKTCGFDSEINFFHMFFPFQLHSLEGKAIQMHRMRERILSESHVGRAQDPPHGRVAAQVSRLQPQLQSAIESQDSPPNAYRFVTAPTSLVCFLLMKVSFFISQTTNLTNALAVRCSDAIVIYDATL